MPSVSLLGTNPGAAPVVSASPQVQPPALDSKDLCPPHPREQAFRPEEQALAHPSPQVELVWESGMWCLAQPLIIRWSGCAYPKASRHSVNQ